MKAERKSQTITATCLLLFSMLIVSNIATSAAWSNGGYTADPANPDYGTHDWIAQHALDFLPTEEKQFMIDNLQTYLYGTEMPDNPQFIGDTSKHHIYFYTNGTLQDDASAARAEQEFQNALAFLKSKDYINASREAGIMSHYIADISVFGHVMGASTAWGTEKHHADYEDYVNGRTSSYNSSFAVYIHFDGNLSQISAYDATKNLAYDTNFGSVAAPNCKWMDDNYNWSSPIFANRSGESINLATNTIADTLHTLYLAANPQTESETPKPSTTQTVDPTPTASTTPLDSPTNTPPTIPEFPPGTTTLAVALSTIVAIAVCQKNRKLTKR